jgi:Cation/multidrug efflux pump
MIFLFLGSWRSTLIVLVSIPLSVLASLAVLAALGQTLNIMTLGGLALAVGILVDDATVAIENTYRLLEEKRDFRHAVVEGAAGVAKPALVSTLAICFAFVSVTFLTDAAKFLFTPQAMAVVFAMLASYALSRTLVPILIALLIHDEHLGQATKIGETHRPNAFGRFRLGFEVRFTRLQKAYVATLRNALERPFLLMVLVVGVMAGAATLAVFLSTDYFPQIDAGQIQLHLRGKSGLRIEDTERLFQEVEDTVREVIPSREIKLVLDNIGLPANNYNLTFSDGSTVGANDGQILIALNERHAPTAVYMRDYATFFASASPEASSIFNRQTSSPRS